MKSVCIGVIGKIPFFANLAMCITIFVNMDAQQIIKKFESIGARAKFLDLAPSRTRPRSPVSINIEKDRRGEFFTVAAAQHCELDIVDVQPRDRHLLLLIREPNEKPYSPDLKSKILCGHDERHWFVASIPDAPGVRNVITAKEALKPEIVKSLERGLKGNFTNRQRRKNPVYLRQGEWFFIPETHANVSQDFVIKNEPLRRGRGKPHMCEFLARSGGTIVYVNPTFPNGLTEEERTKLIRRNSAWAREAWRTMVRDPVVHVRGRVSHADHATLMLWDWHRVVMNTENQARGSSFVAFLD